MSKVRAYSFPIFAIVMALGTTLLFCWLIIRLYVANIPLLMKLFAV